MNKILKCLLILISHGEFCRRFRFVLCITTYSRKLSVLAQSIPNFCIKINRRFNHRFRGFRRFICRLAAASCQRSSHGKSQKRCNYFFHIENSFHYRFLHIRLYYLRKTGIKQGGYKNSKNCKDKCKENFMAYGHEFIYNNNRNVVL